MKKLLFLTLATLLLVGCNDVEPEVVTEPETEWVQEWKYELSTKNNAFLYNPGITKLVAYTSTGDNFTYMVPKFYNYSQIQEEGEYYDGYLRIEPQETVVDKKVKDPHNTPKFIYTFRYLTTDQYFEQKGNWLYDSLFYDMLDITSYNTSEYKDYNEYLTAYENEISTVYKQDVKLEPDVKLVGEEIDHSATAFYLYREVEGVKYYFPCATYYWKLDSGNYLSVHIEIEEESYKTLLDIESLKTLKDKDLTKQLIARSESEYTLLDLAVDISDYIIVGDYSHLFPEDISDRTAWTNLADDIAEVYEEKTTAGFEDTLPVEDGGVSYETETIAHFTD